MLCWIGGAIILPVAAVLVFGARFFPMQLTQEFLIRKGREEKAEEIFGIYCDVRWVCVHGGHAFGTASALTSDGDKRIFLPHTNISDGSIVTFRIRRDGEVLHPDMPLLGGIEQKLSMRVQPP
ncbi:MAG: hypothetical protein AAB908_02985 [Patescibacteria group bacterium]